MEMERRYAGCRTHVVGLQTILDADSGIWAWPSPGFRFGRSGCAVRNLTSSFCMIGSRPELATDPPRRKCIYLAYPSVADKSVWRQAATVSVSSLVGAPSAVLVGQRLGAPARALAASQPEASKPCPFIMPWS